METILRENYHGMDVTCSYSHTENNKDKNEVKSFWMIEAYHNGELKGSWEYNSFRIDPNHLDPNSRYFSALPSEIRQSGKDLVDKLINEKK